MKETLEMLWDEYLSKKCALVNSDEERHLMRETVKLHEQVNALLNKEQQAAVEKYVDALCDTEAIFVRKAFFTGCEFAVSFLTETGNWRK